MSFSVGDRVFWKMKPEYVGTVHSVEVRNMRYARVGVLWDDVPNFGVLVNDADYHERIGEKQDAFEVDE